MTNTLYLPRRHRQPLLFPPGLLALAWLLWLGCVALPQMREVELGHVLPVYMPKYSLCDSAVTDFDKAVELRLYSSVHQLPFCLSQKQLSNFWSWQTISLTGNYWRDDFSYRLATAIADDLDATSNHDAGVRILLSTHATYPQVVRILDWAHNLNSSIYWLDIRHQPIALYVIASESLSSNGAFAYSNNTFPHGPDIFYEEPSVSQQVRGWITSVFSPSLYAQLLHSDWRNTTLLLLLLALLSVSRLYHQHRTH